MSRVGEGPVFGCLRRRARVPDGSMQKKTIQPGASSLFLAARVVHERKITNAIIKAAVPICLHHGCLDNHPCGR
jgi:hypothetical protein